MKRIYITILLSLFISIGFNNNVNAQAPNWLWAKSAGSGNDDFSSSITTDIDGNVIVTGSFRKSITFGTITLTSSMFYEHFYIVKYSPTGVVLWAKAVNGSGAESGMRVSSDVNGNILVTGYFIGSSITFGTTTLTNKGDNDIFIVKYSSTGTVLWATSAGSDDYDSVTGMSTDANGNIFVTGSFSGSSIDLGTINLINTGSGNIFVVKYSPTGTVLWANSVDGNFLGLVNGLSVDVNGNVLMVGSYRNASIKFGATTLNNSSPDKYDIFIVKYSPAGTVLWAKSAGGASQDLSTSVFTDKDGNILLTGSFRSISIAFGTTQLTNSDTSGYTDDIFIVKYSPAGAAMWSNSAGGSSYDISESISVDQIGNVFLTGYFDSPNINFGTKTLINASSGYNDIFVVKYNPTGSVVWATSIGGSSDDIGISISCDASDNVLLTGYFKSHSINFGSNTFVNADNSGNTYDFYIAKLGNVSVGVKETETSPSNINIYPNPFSTQASIVFAEEQKNTSIKIIDVLGKEIKTSIFTGREFVINKAEMPEGIYFVQITDENKNVQNKKIVIQ